MIIDFLESSRPLATLDLFECCMPRNGAAAGTLKGKLFFNFLIKINHTSYMTLQKLNQINNRTVIMTVKFTKYSILFDDAKFVL